MARRNPDVALIVAMAIRRTGRPQCNGGESLPQPLVDHTRRVVQHIADELAREVAGFSRDRFMVQCGFSPSQAVR